MSHRLFIGKRLGVEYRVHCHASHWTWTLYEGKWLCGQPLPYPSSMQDIKTIAQELERSLSTLLPDVKLPPTILIAELIIG